MSIEILGIDNVLFGVRDLDEAVALYERIGFKLRFRVPKPPLALFDAGDERPGLLLREEAAPSSGRFWVEVKDAGAVAAELASMGLPTQTLETATGWTVEIRDPSGNTVGFADYRKRPERGR